MDVCTFNKEGICSILKGTACKKCSFFKTEKELQEGRAKARESIEALPPQRLADIVAKYYGSGNRYYKERGIV